MKLNPLLLLPLLLLFLLAPATAREAEIRGVWIHTYGPFDWDTEMKKVADAGFNTVFFRVARGINAQYPSQVLARDDWAAAATHDEMQRAIDAAHRNGLEFHAWKVCFHAGGAAKQKGEARVLYEQMAKDDRLVRGLDGQQGPFLNPADPRNQELELNALREITEKYNVDGVHLDYIRYPDDPHFDYDYGDVSRREFEKHLGRAVANWPQDVYSGALKWQYENWERENINRLVQRVYQQTKALKPRVQVSAAVWRAHRKHRATVKQDWIHWANNGWLDFVVPMNYTKDDNQFREDVRSQVANSADKVLLAAGIGNYQHETPEKTLQQIEIARREGSDGYVLFDYRPEKYVALLDELQKKVQASRVSLPYEFPDGALHQLRWSVGNGTARKDEPIAYLAGAKATASLIRPLRWVGGFSPMPVDWSVRLETLDGELITTLVEFKQKPLYAPTPQERLVRFNAAVPPGKSRFVLRAETWRRDGKTHLVRKQYIARGPVIEGLSSQEILDLHARQKPPLVFASGKRVGIYAGGMADTGLLRVLQNAAGTNAYLFHQLEPEHWAQAQVLVLPQLRDMEEFSPEVVRDLREWVTRGGVLLLTHDAVGYRWHLRAFPEIGEGVALSKTRDVEVVENEWGFAAGKWQHEYPDHVVIEPGQWGQVLARDAEGLPVLVCGHFGKGKVFLYGSLLGYAPGGVLGAGETQLLHDLVKSHAETQRR